VNGEEKAWSNSLRLCGNPASGTTIVFAFQTRDRLRSHGNARGVAT
jgi:hypothetical protein